MCVLMENRQLNSVYKIVIKRQQPFAKAMCHNFDYTKSEVECSEFEVNFLTKSSGGK